MPNGDQDFVFLSLCQRSKLVLVDIDAQLPGVHVLRVDQRRLGVDATDVHLARLVHVVAPALAALWRSGAAGRDGRR